MNTTDHQLPEHADQSAIVNKDVAFENSAVDPGFASEAEHPEAESQEKDADKSTKKRSTEQDEHQEEQDEQGTERGASGLGELDGTNPGSNHHPMDHDS